MLEWPAEHCHHVVLASCLASRAMIVIQFSGCSPCQPACPSICLPALLIWLRTCLCNFLHLGLYVHLIWERFSLSSPPRKFCFHPCMFFVCLFFCDPNKAKTTDWISMKPGWRMRYGSGENPLHFGADPIKSANPVIMFTFSLPLPQNSSILWG